MADLENLPDPVYPTGYPAGSANSSIGANTIFPESPEVLHRPHAFALMHGKRGAKVAYGELHYLVNSFKLQFHTSAISVADHDDHSHYAHTTSNHQHTHAHTHNVEDHTHSCGDCGSGGSGSGSGATGGLTSSLGTQGANPETTSSAGSETLTHSGVRDVSDGSSTAPPAVLSHTVSGQITYCSGAYQETLGNITQKVPNYPTEDGALMIADINDVKYHELNQFGDVYLCWKVDLEEVGNEVTKCWVQIGEPDGDPVTALNMGTATTNRRNSSTPHTATGQKEGEEAGVYYVKLGMVIPNEPVKQYISSDVVWQPTVLDRIEIT